ncbi:MAG: Transcriptional regulator, TetR family [Gemmatimonadetes bacterium]|nr:Transcriptional regulator, TetR family [Gemmatimonadota bacterium]
MQRARSSEEKRERRGAILDAALAAYEADPSFAAFTMDALARAAGLGKGTLYLYFRTKEEVFLALVDARFGAWFDEIDAGLDEDGGGAWTGGRAAAVLMRSTRWHTTLARLLSILGTVVEHNVPFETALAFKRGVMARAHATGERLERRLPFLRPGQGARLLVWLHAMVIGLWQLHEPSATIRRIMQDPALEGARVDFGRDLGTLLRIMLRGMQAEAEDEAS